MLVSNWLFSSPEVQRLGADPPARAELLALEERVGQLVERARKLGGAAAALDNHVIMVTNEVGLGLIPPNPLSRMYRDVLGRVNRVLAEQAEQVLFMVSGLPWRIKSEPGGGPLPGG
jgi:adenosylcobinamide kinase/adenosylcobinamide-phosphate guanylyltransferase